MHVYIPHRDAVYRLAIRKMPSIDLAEDVVQEVFVRAFQSFCQIGDPKQIHAWLFGIAGNVMSDIYRRVYKIEHHNEAIAAQSAAGRKSTPMELRIVLLQEMGALPEPLQETLLLSFENELSSREIAQRLDIAEGTVRWRLSEARRELKIKLIRRIQDMPNLADELGIGEENHDLTAR